MQEGATVVEFEKARLNVWNVGGLVVVAVVQAFVAGGVYMSIDSKLDDLDSRIVAETLARKERGIQTDGNFKDLRDQMPKIQDLQAKADRLTELSAENRAGISDANKRIDRVVESFGGKLDALNEGVNKLATSFAVLSSQIKEKPQPTSLRAQ